MIKYGIIGTGAVGGYYGGLLAHHGFDVHFLLRSDFLHVKENGLIVESKDKDFTLPAVNAYSDAKNMPQCDVVIIALKTTQNRQLASIIPHVLKKGGIVVALQNGLGIEADIAQIVPDAVILGGLCFLCSNKIGPGHIKHLDYGAISLGEYLPGYKPAGITKNIKLISDEFKQAGISVKPSDNLGESRWRKLVWNIPFNGLSVVLNAATDQLVNTRSTYDLAKDLMIEVISGAKKCGFYIEDDFADKMLKETKQMAIYKPSMQLDFEAKRPLEIEKIYFKPIAEAKSAGYSMTAVRTLALQLEFLDHKNQLQPLLQFKESTA